VTVNARSILAAVLIATCTPPVFGGARPSFLILLTDDLRGDCLSCAGHRLVKTPAIDRLAREGTRFRNAFVTTSICCVSRASFITGQYARRHRVADFSTPIPPERLRETYPGVLKQAGYRTACFGKWGLGGTPPLEVFDVWDAWGGQGEYFHEVDGETVHNSEYLARRAEEFLRSQPRDRPFCLLVYYKSPHDPYQPDPRDLPLFRDDRIEIPPTADAAHFEALPEFLRRSEGRTRALKSHPTPEAYQEFVRQYLRLVAGVDRSVGKIRAVLDELNRTDETVIVFSSDNGFFLGERGLSHKWLMHEESIRIPLIVRDPVTPVERRGETHDELVLNIDLAPTILDRAGAAIPPSVDGKSLAPLLERRPVAWREDFFYEHHFHNASTIPRTEGVRTRDSKYIMYHDVEPAYEELYNLRDDPREERNLAEEPSSREQLQALRRRHAEYVARLGPAALPGGPPPMKLSR
jgi:arylsulfatase A-like enzyme